jgi:hypothetical protein
MPAMNNAYDRFSVASGHDPEDSSDRQARRVLSIAGSGPAMTNEV